MSTATQNPFFSTLGTPPNFIRDVQAFTARMAAMPRVMEIAQNVKVGTTPHEVTHSEDRLRVLHYQSDVEKAHRTPLLIAFALVNRPYILDLLPHKSVVRQFLNRGFDVYLIDWGVPTANDRHLTLENYVERYMHNVVNHVRKRSGEDQISLMGYCMGGTLCAMYTSLHQDLIRNFILMAAPIDWSDRESLLSVWTDEKNFDVDKMIDVFGNAPPSWLQSSFAMLKPVTNFMEKYVGFYERMTDETFLEEFFAMETWANDNIPVAGETFRQFVKDCYQKNLLVQGKLMLGKKRIDLSKIECPVLNLVASRDHLVPCGQSLPFNDCVGSTDRKAINFPAGHIGLAVGGKAQRELWPKVCDWLAERSDEV
ncbi:MAG: class III poly(R)-hydroxyalkanoic acid synthase subunit PhaC [Planctomycetota bacterium]|nr:class III poly(R)-hydroxyalkanoic acid synthase subunit PhaC [Planctomycetota bacterium]MCZ6816616.1 class III poly(R)-hydroxyalkanoic acid synthase subunit PhaC [Planctomycetota bacterium]